MEKMYYSEKDGTYGSETADTLGAATEEGKGSSDAGTLEDEASRLRNKYKKQDGKVYEIKTSIQEDDETEKEYDFIFRKPNTSSYDRYVKTASASATKALRVFVLDNICDEQKEQLRALFEEYPAMAIGLGEKLLNMLGLSKDTTVKKL